MHNARCFELTDCIHYPVWQNLHMYALLKGKVPIIRCAGPAIKALEDKTVDDLAELYSSAMTRLLDQHCPVVQVRHKVKQTIYIHPGTTPTAVQLAGVCEQQKDAFDGRVLRQTGVPGRTR